MSPKYRHRGYQDSDDDDRERQRQQQPRRDQLTMEEKIQRRSMRKATDPEAHETLRCHVCGRDIVDYTAIEFGTKCPKCDAALHCCRVCRFFNTAARRQCATKTDQPVGNKIKSNECKQYEPLLVLDVTGRRGSPGSPSGGGSGSARDMFDNLFKN